MTPNLILIAFFLIIVYSINGERNSLESVPDLEKAMYVNVEGYPCVRLLNLSGEIGCSNPSHEKVVAPILRLKDSHDQLLYSSAIVIPLKGMQSFFHRVSQDPHFAQNVAGVLVESAGSQKTMPEFSPVEKFPQAGFAPYQNLSYEWNPAGSGIMWNHYNFPVFLLSEESTSFMQEIIGKNENRNNAHHRDVAEFDLVMQTTKGGNHDSESCLKERTCLPLGGYRAVSGLLCHQLTFHL